MTLEGKSLKQVNDFKYLGSWIAKSKKDMDVRIGMAWKALNKMEKVWKSGLHRLLKVKFFRATVESVLLYGAESWTLTKVMTRRLDGTYTRMLRVVLGFKWSEHKTNKELYGDLKSVSDVLLERRLRFARHTWRRKEEIVSQTFF